MAAEVVLGTNAFTLINKEHLFVDGEGWREIQNWQGPQALLEAFKDATETTSPARIYARSGVPAEVSVEYIDTNNLVADTTIWELVTSPMDRPLATHPAFNTSGSSVQTIEDIEQAIRKGVAAGQDFDTPENMNAFRDLRLKGIDSYRMWTFVIRKTLTSSKAELLPIEEQNTQKVVQYNEIGIPALIKWSQPSIKYWNGAAAELLLVNQWLAGPLQYRYEGLRYTINREWVGAIKWYSVLYEGGTAASDDDGQSHW